MQAQHVLPIRENQIENILSLSCPEFPVYITENDLSDLNNHAHLWHWHHALQLCVVTEGPIIFFANEQSFLIESGNGIFINESCLHRSSGLQRPCGKYICIDFDLRILRTFLGSAMENQLHEFMSCSTAKAIKLSCDVPWMKSILDSVKTIYKLNQEQTPAYEMFICSHLFQVMGNLLRYSEQILQVNRHTEHSQQMRNVLDYIHTYYTKPITIRDLANIAHVSESELCRLFKRFFHCTVFSYILECRVRKGTELLLNSEESVTQIAYLCGFSSTSYFIRQFREHMGCTPAHYRKSHRNTELRRK